MAIVKPEPPSGVSWEGRSAHLCPHLAGLKREEKQDEAVRITALLQYRTHDYGDVLMFDLDGSRDEVVVLVRES